MTVIIKNEQTPIQVTPIHLKRRLGKVLRAMGLGLCSITVLLTDDASIRALNREFRGLDKSTNVLAFPFVGPPSDGRDPPEISGVTLPTFMLGYLGDVAVSAETVVRESAEGGEPEGFLLYFYLIHGILHLAGHNHELGEAEEKAQDEETRRLMALIRHTLP